MTRRTMLYLIAALSTATIAGAADIPSDLRSSIRRRDDASAQKDIAAWDRLTTSDFVAIRPDGGQVWRVASSQGTPSK